jgi:hypothetical protein
MDVAEALTETAEERALVARLIEPKTRLERWYGTRFEVAVERDVPGHLEDENLPDVRKRVEDTIAINDGGGGGFVREVERTAAQVQWAIYAPSSRTSSAGYTPPTNTGTRVVLTRELDRTRVFIVVRLGSPWLMLGPPGLAAMIWGIGLSVGAAVGGVVVGAALAAWGRGALRESSRAKLRTTVRTMDTICDAVRDGSALRSRPPQ